MSFRSDFLRALPAVHAPPLLRRRRWRCFGTRPRTARPTRSTCGTGPPTRQPWRGWRIFRFCPSSFSKPTRCAPTPAEWEPQEVFLSSGTTLQQRSRHLVRDPALYRENAARIFEQHYGPLSGWTFLALLPSYLEQGQSSLVAMVDYFARQSGQTQPAFFLHDHAALRAALAEAKQQPGRRVMLIGVSYALLDFAAEAGPAPELQGLTVLETGGMKGRRREMIREELHQELQQAFGPAGIHSEYGMTELLSQAYSLGDGRFHCPAPLRVLLRDPSDPFSIGRPERWGHQCD